MAIKYPKPGLLNGVAPRSARTYFTDADDAITISQKLNKQSNNTNYTSLKGLVVKELARPGGGKTIFVYFDVLHYSISKTLSPDNAEYFLTRVDIDDNAKDGGTAEGTIVEVSFQNGDYQTGFLTRVIRQGSGSPDSATVQSTNFFNPCARPSTSVVDTIADNASALSAKGVSTPISTPVPPQPVADPCGRYAPTNPEQIPQGYISKYFKISDFDRYNDTPKAPPLVVENLARLAKEVLDPLQDAIGEPLKVTPNGGYNGPGVDAAFAKKGKGLRKSTSQHRQGKAADIPRPKRFSNYNAYKQFVFEWLANLPDGVRNKITICTYSSSDNFIHFDIRGANDGKAIAQVGDKKIRYVDFA